MSIIISDLNRKIRYMFARKKQLKIIIIMLHNVFYTEKKQLVSYHKVRIKPQGAKNAIVSISRNNATNSSYKCCQ